MLLTFVRKMASLSTKQSGFLRLVIISDTHSDHQNISCLPEGDILIHCGDLAKSSTNLNPKEYSDFTEWFVEQPHPEKILICGNRDEFMDTGVISHRIKDLKEITKVQNYILKEESINYLNDSSYVINCEHNSINIWGSPWTQQYGSRNKIKAFQLPAGQLLREKWEKIPTNTDILMTHGPPYGICDLNTKGTSSGCPELLQIVQNRIKPRLHLFGHIHEAFGIEKIGPTLFVNAAMLNKETKKIGNKPVVLDYPTDANSEIIIVQGALNKLV